MLLSDEAKELMHKEFENLTKPIDQTLRELELYKWALRGLFVLLFGGSIIGVFKLQDYLDERIMNRNEEYSGLIYGSMAQSANNARLAVDQYYSFLEKLDNVVYRPNEVIRSIYYERFIGALADANEVEPQGEFEVKGAFLDLVGSKSFKNDYLVNTERWRNNSIFQNAWGRCLLKFGATPKDTDVAQQFFERASLTATRPSEIAANRFAIGMLALSKGNVVDARKYIGESVKLSPSTHGLEHFTGEMKNDLEDELEIWKRASRVYGTTGIEQKYKKIISGLRVTK